MILGSNLPKITELLLERELTTIWVILSIEIVISSLRKLRNQNFLDNFTQKINQGLMKWLQQIKLSNNQL